MACKTFLQGAAKRDTDTIKKRLQCEQKKNSLGQASDNIQDKHCTKHNRRVSKGRPQPGGEVLLVVPHAGQDREVAQTKDVSKPGR